MVDIIAEAWLAQREPWKARGQTWFLASEPRTISPGCAPHRACQERIPEPVRYHALSGRRNPFL